MTDREEPARAAIGSLPPNEPQPVEEESAGQQTPEVANRHESATAPTESGVQGQENLAASLGAVDPLAFVSSIKSLVSLGTKVLGVLAKFPGPQQAMAQEVLKLLDEVNSLLGKLPI